MNPLCFVLGHKFEPVAVLVRGSDPRVHWEETRYACVREKCGQRVGDWSKVVGADPRFGSLG